jgi:FtsZ-interacting cell division protein YlmF
MKTNYGEVIEKIESKKAKDRLKTKSIFQENQGLPASENIYGGRKPLKIGETRNLTGKEIGISGPTFSKGKEVVKRIDTEEDESVKWFFQDVMNNDSVEAAYNLSKKPKEFVDKVKETKNIINKPTTKIINELEKKEYFESRKFDPPSSESKYVESVDDILKFSIDVIIYEGNKYEDLVKIMDRLKPDSYIFIFHDNMSLSKLNPLSEYIKIRGRIINIWKNMEISTNNYSYNKKHSIIYHAKKKDGKDRPLIGDYPDVHFSSTPESIYSFILETASIEGMNVLDITGNVNLESVCLKMKRNYILLKEI